MKCMYDVCIRVFILTRYREADDLRTKLRDIQLLRVKRSNDANEDDHVAIDKLQKNLIAIKAVC